jgi:hypothetical protein
MWNGIYKRWNPIPALDGQRVYLEAVHDDWEGVRVWLRPEDKTKPMAIFRFDTVEAYFSSNESNRICRISPEQNLELPHAFWRVEDSEFLEVVSKQSCGTEREGLSHFAFLSCDDCIDVLAWEPEVKFET